MKDHSPLREDPKAREAFFMQLYKSTFPQVARYVSKMGGTLEEAKDVFQDSVVIYYEQTVVHSLVIRQSEKAYVTGIARHLWLKQYRETANLSPLHNDHSVDVDEDTSNHFSSEKILRFLETSGKKCLELLQAVYYHRASMKDVATRFGFSGERSATVQKYKCLEKVRTVVKEKSLAYEDFHE